MGDNVWIVNDKNDVVSWGSLLFPLKLVIPNGVEKYISSTRLWNRGKLAWYYGWRGCETVSTAPGRLTRCAEGSAAFGRSRRATTPIDTTAPFVFARVPLPGHVWLSWFSHMCHPMYTPELVTCIYEMYKHRPWNCVCISFDKRSL
jgi:hypothetical protein